MEQTKTMIMKPTTTPDQDDCWSRELSNEEYFTASARMDIALYKQTGNKFYLSRAKDSIHSAKSVKKDGIVRPLGVILD